MVSHWLMKTEPEAFGIDDLARVKVEPWTGVRNYMARNLMRDRMQAGDEVLFYHSSCEPPGVAGLARVVRTGVVDATQFDPESKYFDPESKREAPRWICVDVEYVRHAPRFVPLAELRAHPGLANMMLLQRGARLSVQPVSPEHHAIIVGLTEQPAPTEVAPPARSEKKAKTKAKAKATKTKAKTKTKATKTKTKTKPRTKATAKRSR